MALNTITPNSTSTLQIHSTCSFVDVSKTFLFRNRKQNLEKSMVEKKLQNFLRFFLVVFMWQSVFTLNFTHTSPRDRHGGDGLVVDLQLPMQSVPINTKVVSLNPAHDEVFLIQHYVIKFFCNLWQVGGTVFVVVHVLKLILRNLGLIFSVKNIIAFILQNTFGGERECRVKILTD